MPDPEGNEKEIILTQCAVWEALGITEIRCNYSGSGDEGGINDFEIEPTIEGMDDAKAGLECGDYPYKPIYSAFDRLSFFHTGWDNEGGGGNIIVDVKARTITRSEYYNEGIGPEWDVVEPELARRMPV